MDRYTEEDARFDDEQLRGPRCPRHGRGCSCCIDCGAPAGTHTPSCRYARENLDTIDLRVGRMLLHGGIEGPELVAWVFVNGEPVAGYANAGSWARARRHAQRTAGELWYRARLCGLSAHPNARPRWRSSNDCACLHGGECTGGDF